MSVSPLIKYPALVNNVSELTSTDTESPSNPISIPAECSVCGEGFKKNKPWQRFCSKECRAKWHTELKLFADDMIERSPKIQALFLSWLAKR